MLETTVSEISAQFRTYNGAATSTARSMHLKDTFCTRTVTLILVFAVHQSWTSNYHCGPTDNAFFRYLSQLLTLPCEQQLMNLCCLKHDQCYDDCNVMQLVCDTSFCDCLKGIRTNFYCRTMVQPIHCNFPQWFGKPYKCSSQRDA